MTRTISTPPGWDASPSQFHSHITQFNFTRDDIRPLNGFPVEDTIKKLILRSKSSLKLIVTSLHKTVGPFSKETLIT